jgi:hypothetical protein
MLGHEFVQVIAEMLPYTEPLAFQPQELAFGADALEEHHQLQAKEDSQIDAWPPPCQPRSAPQPGRAQR